MTRSDEEILEIARTFPINRYVVWAGTGVSREKPTTLPLGNDLTEFIMNLSCGISVSEKIQGVWKSANKFLGEQVFGTNEEWPLGEMPRLEAILDAVVTVESASKNEKHCLTQGFLSFGERPYNEDHWHIASLLV